MAGKKIFTECKWELWITSFFLSLDTVSHASQMATNTWPSCPRPQSAKITAVHYCAQVAPCTNVSPSPSFPFARLLPVSAVCGTWDLRPCQDSTACLGSILASIPCGHMVFWCLGARDASLLPSFKHLLTALIFCWTPLPHFFSLVDRSPPPPFYPLPKPHFSRASVRNETLMCSICYIWNMGGGANNFKTWIKNLFVNQCTHRKT